MLSLSPAKLLVVLVIALIVLGPEKLPGVARQIGAAWGDLRRFRARLETEVREVFPDLPPAKEISRAVRSPVSFLDRLADEHERGNGATSSADAGSPTSPGATAPAVPASPASAAAPGNGVRSPGTAPGDETTPVVPDDPSMN